jgi:sugar phosphate isomerase/epimerase
MLQVGSTDSPADKISTATEDIVADLRELADTLAAHNMRLAYENWCWSTHAPTWRDVWNIVRQVDRPNVGLCLDTFQTAGSEWADPTTASGMVEEDEGAGIPEFEEMPVDKRFGDSLVALSRTIPADKVYLLQISDAYKPEPKPLEASEVDGMRPRARWSHAFRPLPYHGGYLPVEAVTRAVLGTGFRGWFSIEVFDGGPRCEGKARDMHAFARTARESVDTLIQRSAPVSTACCR